MARKKKSVSIQEPPKEFPPEQIEAGLSICHQEYFMQVVGLLSHNPEVKELDYVKVPVSTPEGGIYLVSILHVEGPKLNLQNLAKVADQKVADEQSKKV